MPPADTPAKVEQPCPTPLLFRDMQRTAETNPGLVLACAGLLPTEIQRDMLRRSGFLAAISRDLPAAARYLPGLVERPWITDPGFFAILTFAKTYPEVGRELLIKAARRYPDIALREYSGYQDLSYGSEIFEGAATAAPDEAAGMASGNSPASQGILAALKAGSSARMRVLARIATAPDMTPWVRQRAAVFSAAIAERRVEFNKAVEAARGPNYFAALTNLRLSARPSEAAILDRVLEKHAEVLFRTMEDRGGQASELTRLSAADVYLLLTYGRTEEDDVLFAAVFDRLLLPKLRAAGLAKLLSDVHDLNLRRFLTAAIAHRRFEAFLATAGARARQTDILERCMEGLGAAGNPVEEMVNAAEILAAVNDPVQLDRLKDAVLREYARGGQDRALYGLMCAALKRRSPVRGAAPDSVFDAIASEYGAYLREPRVLEKARLFDAGGVSIQQHVFFDDDDAAESFHSFQNTYAHDPAWHWEERGWHVRVTGAGAAGRRIEIYANVPRSVNQGGSGNRRDALAKLLREQRLTPSVLVQRGHTWYVAEALEYLNPSTRLVFLGSCRGLLNAASVIGLANQAQFIATRGIGTTSINDALLKAVNDELLRDTPNLDWEVFWRATQVKFGSNPLFRDYLPPSRNATAIMLTAYYSYAAGGS